MLKETNLNGLKPVARMLLMIPIRETPYSPAVVWHSFTSCGIAPIVQLYQNFGLLYHKKEFNFPYGIRLQHISIIELQKT